MSQLPDLSQMSLSELFAEGDRIGNKCQTPQEQKLAAQRLQRAIATLKASEEPTYTGYPNANP